MDDLGRIRPQPFAFDAAGESNASLASRVGVNVQGDEKLSLAHAALDTECRAGPRCQPHSRRTGLAPLPDAIGIAREQCATKIRVGDFVLSVSSVVERF